jgi:hypothetical protein
MVLNPQRLNLPGALRVEITHALSARFEFQIKTRQAFHRAAARAKVKSGCESNHQRFFYAFCASLRNFIRPPPAESAARVGSRFSIISCGGGVED